MRVSRSFVFGIIMGVTAVALSGASDPIAAQIPEAWLITGTDADDYRLRLDTEVVRSGASSMRLAARGNRRRSQWAVSVQMIDATAYRGKRVRLRGYMRTDDIESGGLWLRLDGIVDGNYAMLALDNSEGRRVEGTEDWTPREIIVDVPPESVTILLGAMITGDGTLWVDDLTFEEVSLDLETTADDEIVVTDAPYARPPGVFPFPVNLDFERAVDPGR